jgi:hypothetical protein
LPKGYFPIPKRFQRAGAQGFQILITSYVITVVKVTATKRRPLQAVEAGPSSNLQADQNIAAIFPPASRQSERDFPKQAEKEKQKKRETERAPVA